MKAVRDELNKEKASKEMTEQEMSKLRADYEQRIAEVEMNTQQSSECSLDSC